MKIKDTYISFTGQVVIGKFAFFIELDSSGVELNVDDIFEQIIHFPRIVIFGEKEIFEQRNDIAKLIKKASKINPDIVFDLFTYGEIKPVKIINLDNVNYNVIVRLKDSNISYAQRVQETTLKWYNNMFNSIFLFYIKNQNNIDETNLIIQDVGLKKSKVTISVNHHLTDEELDMIIKNCRHNGYNFNIDFKNIFWPLVGKSGDQDE